MLFTQTDVDKDGQPVRDDHSTSYIATFEDANSFAQAVKDEHIRRSFYRAHEQIIIGDGAKWIWTIADRDWPDAIQIVDYYHACEHVQDIVNQLAFMLAHPDQLTATLISYLDKGDINAMTRVIADLHLKPGLANKIDTQLDYFRRNAHRMRYDVYKAKGWFVGSGQVEAACKTVVAVRAKQSGMRWTIKGLDPIITLRALHQSGRDHLIWDQHLSQTYTAQAA